MAQIDSGLTTLISTYEDQLATLKSTLPADSPVTACFEASSSAITNDLTASEVALQDAIDNCASSINPLCLTRVCFYQIILLFIKLICFLPQLVPKAQALLALVSNAQTAEEILAECQSPAPVG